MVTRVLIRGVLLLVGAHPDIWFDAVEEEFAESGFVSVALVVAAPWSGVKALRSCFRPLSEVGVALSREVVVKEGALVRQCMLQCFDIYSSAGLEHRGRRRARVALNVRDLEGRTLQLVTRG